MLFITGVLFLMVLVLAATFLIFLYFQWSFQYWKKRNVPHLKGTFPLGSAVSTNLHGGQNLQIMHQELKKQGLKHGGIYAFSTPKYLLVDPQIIQQILIRDFSNFWDRGVTSNDVNDPLRESFVFLEREQWRSVRMKLMHSFTKAKLKIMFDTFLKSAGQMENVLQKLCENNEPVDLKELIECFTIDVIGSSAFGVECNSFEYACTEFKRHLRGTFTNLSLFRFLNMSVIQLYPKLAKLFRLKLYRRNATDFFGSVIKDALASRGSNGPGDFLQFLIEGWDYPNVDEKKQTVLEKIIPDVYAIFAGGSDSSSTAIAVGLFELAMQPDIQQKLRSEIHEALEDANEITYDTIMNMKYLDQIVCEVLRKYPTVSFLFRRCLNEYKIPGSDVILEKDMFIFVSVLGLHFDPEYFPQPEKFDPERFNETNKRNIRPFTYLPFGDGPRKCLGYRYVDMLVKIALVAFIRNYQVTVHKIPELPLKYNPLSLTLCVKQKLFISMKKI